MSRGEPAMPRTPEEFNNYVAKELRAGDKRMDEIVKTVAAIQIEQASAKVLLAENTETINEIKTDTADMLEVFESWKGAMRVMEMIGKLAKPPIDLLFFWQGPDHCKNAYIKEFARKNYPDEYRAGTPIFEPRK